MPLGLDHLGVLHPDSLVLLSEVAGRPADVVRVLGLAGDARDTQEVLELLEALLAGLFQKFLRCRHNQYCCLHGDMTAPVRRPAAHRALGRNNDGLVCAYRPHTAPARRGRKAGSPCGLASR